MIEIRVHNASDMDFDRVRVVFPERNEVDYGRLARGALSAFRATGHAYRYAHIDVRVGDRHYSLEPIDYVGEQPLTPGRYTYVLGIDSGRLTVELEVAQ